MIYVVVQLVPAQVESVPSPILEILSDIIRGKQEVEVEEEG